MSASAIALGVAGVALTGLLFKAWFSDRNGDTASGIGKNAARNKKRREKAAQLKSQLQSSKQESSSHDTDNASTKASSMAQASHQGGKVAIQPERPTPAAERHLKRKKGKQPAQIADMIDREVVQEPQAARVLSVKPQKVKSNNAEWPALPVPAKDFQQSLDRPEDTSTLVEDEGAWQEIPAKVLSIKTKPASSFNNTSNQMQSPKRAVPGLPEEMSKKARQNAAKREREKQAKEEAEADRVARLNDHRKDRASSLTQQRAFAAQNKNAKSQSFFNTKQAKQLPSKQVSGGMSAAVHDGALVWE